jgi:hypothetical protein
MEIGGDYDEENRARKREPIVTAGADSQCPGRDSNPDDPKVRGF